MEWGIAYYGAPDGSIPAETFLDGCPTKVEAKLLAVLEVVRAAPPPAFSGGGKWEAMHGSMGGYYEVRCKGPASRPASEKCVQPLGWIAFVERRQQLDVAFGRLKTRPTAARLRRSSVSIPNALRTGRTV